MTPSIRKASVDEVSIVSDILREAARWLTEKGEPLWREDELLPDKVNPDIENGLFYIAWIGDEAAGVFKFQTTDKLFWPEVPEAESTFIHRVAVRRKFAGRRIAVAMIDHAKAATEAMGRQFLRLDCEASRPKLCKVYENEGFVKHSTKQVGPYFVVRYQFKIIT